MAKTSVKNKTCGACGATVRPGSLFCFNCGEAVGSEIDGRARPQKTVKEALLEERSKENGDFKTTRLDDKLAETTPGPVEMAEPHTGQPIPKPTETEDEGKLKTAAAMRRKPKSFQKKTVEIVWEEPDQAPNKWFPLVALFLMLFVALIFYLAMSLK